MVQQVGWRTLNDVRSTLALWREDYNCERPHSSLDYRTPQEFRRALAMQMWKALRASHIHTASAATRLPRSQTLTENLQL